MNLANFALLVPGPWLRDKSIKVLARTMGMQCWYSHRLEMNLGPVYGVDFTQIREEIRVSC